MYRKRVLAVVFVYDLHTIGKIGESRVNVVEILLQPVEGYFINKKEGERERERQEDETRRSTPALPKASLSVAISAVSIPLLAFADVYVVLVEYWAG